MRLGIVGLPGSGKSAVFNALTSNAPAKANHLAGGRIEVRSATVNVPDARLDALSAVFQPRKTVYAQVTYSDIAGVDRGISEGALAGPLRNELAQMDGFLHVVRAFKSEAVPHPYGAVDPARDVGVLDGEFLLIDLIAVEKRLERLEQDRHKVAAADKKMHEREMALFQRLHAHLSADRPLRDMEDLTPDELKALRGYGFLSLKPVLIVLNHDEDGPTHLDYPHQRSAVAAMQAQLEAEIAQLDETDAAVFRAEYGIHEPAAARIIACSYALLGLHVFFTIGDDEVRAWTLPVGATALEAAGAVHSDFARGFIRAAVTRYEDVVAMEGSFARLRAAGKTRMEGRDYVVCDGDVIEVFFNV